MVRVQKRDWPVMKCGAYTSWTEEGPTYSVVQAQDIVSLKTRVHRQSCIDIQNTTNIFTRSVENSRQMEQSGWSPCARGRRTSYPKEMAAAMQSIRENSQLHPQERSRTIANGHLHYSLIKLNVTKTNTTSFLPHLKTLPLLRQTRRLHGATANTTLTEP
jgi:hypothetical protein